MFVGDDLFELENEIEKLSLYKNKEKEISQDDIDLLIKAKFSSNIFDLMDAIGERNYKKGTRAIRELIMQGESEIYILTMIAKEIKNLLLVAPLKDNYSKDQIISKTKLHPYVVQKSLAFVKKFKIKELKEAYKKILETDIAIKKGEIDPRLGLTFLLKEIIK